MTARCRTLISALCEAANTTEGFVFAAGAAERRQSYREIHAASSRLARALRTRGLGRGDLVAVIVGDPEQFLTSLFGASMAGVVPASLYPPAATDLVHDLASTAGILRSARARAVVTTPSLAASIETLRPTCPDLDVIVTSDALTADEGPYAAGNVLPDDIAFVQFTSGSTSEPKGVVVTHRMLSANIEAINGPAGLATTSSDSAVSWLPLYHDMGLVGMALGAMYAMRPAVLMTPETFVKRPAEWLRAIARHRATVSFAPNFAYDLCVRRIRERDLADLDLSSWRVAGCGGEPIHAGTLAAFAAKFAPSGFRSTSFLPSYGLAEHVLAATFPPRDRSVRVARSSNHVEVVSCGRPLPDHKLRIANEDGVELADGAIGEIELSGPSVTPGYYGDQELTDRTIRDGWLHTGDLGFIDGGELFVCGRTKDVLVVSGRKHHPQDLEWAVDELPGIRRGRVVAFGVSRDGAADRVVMIVEPNRTVAVDVLEHAVRQRVREVCGLYVDEILFVSSGTIGRTTSGKVQRAATKRRFETGEIVDIRVKLADQ